MTTLLLDSGNSRLKWGLLEADQIVADGSIQSPAIDSNDLHDALAAWPDRIDAALACNVAGPDVARLLAEAVTRRCHVELGFAASTRAACEVRNAYDEPRQLGVDRWVALIGARSLTRKPCLVVDAGTAITLDVLDAQGHHQGGQILPGIQLMADSLGLQTNDLPTIDAASLPAELLATPLASSTHAAISKGIASAVLGAVERGIASVRSNYGDAQILLTGGNAHWIAAGLTMPVRIEPQLVLLGLACMAQD